MEKPEKIFTDIYILLRLCKRKLSMYLLFSILNFNFSPSEWNSLSRIIFIMIIVFLLFYYGDLRKKYYKYRQQN